MLQNPDSLTFYNLKKKNSGEMCGDGDKEKLFHKVDSCLASFKKQKIFFSPYLIAFAYTSHLITHLI